MKNKEILPNKIWNDDKTNALKNFISFHTQKQTKQQKLKIEELAIRYNLEDKIIIEPVD